MTVEVLYSWAEDAQEVIQSLQEELKAKEAQVERLRDNIQESMQHFDSVLKTLGLEK